MSSGIYNTGTEIGLRYLLILKELYPEYCTVEKLLYLDHMSLYIEDYEVSQNNLHPRYPFQLLEVIEKKSIADLSLKKLISKELIEVDIEGGFKYKANTNSFWFLGNIQCEYSEKFSKNIREIVSNYKNKSDTALNEIVVKSRSHIHREFSEFYPYKEEEL